MPLPLAVLLFTCLLLLPTSGPPLQELRIPLSLTDSPYLQEFGRTHTVLPDLQGKEIISLAVDDSDALWIGSAQGLFRFSHGTLTKITDPHLAGVPILALAPSGSSVWAASAKGLYRVSPDGAAQPAPNGAPKTVNRLHATPDGTLYASGPQGLGQLTDARWLPLPVPTQDITDFAPAPDGVIWVASKEGLWRGQADQWQHLTAQSHGLPSDEVRALAADSQGHLWVGTPEGLCLLDPKGENPSVFTGQHRLPWPDVTSLHLASDGSLLIGTARGCAKLEAGQWRFYHSQRWLPNDRVNCVARQRDGSVWIGTPEGPARVEFRLITLEDKSRLFIDRLRQRHLRHGFVPATNRLRRPGDPPSSVPNPSDNDGLWTALYLGAESFRFAATADQQAHANAWESAQALIAMQEVTGVPGLIARCLWFPEDKEEKTGEWHDLPDGRRWKGDASSDELVGHFFGLSVFHDLAAQGEEKQRAAQAIRAIMDHLIRNDYHLVDLDGQPTSWGVFHPQTINHDPEWERERALSSLELLSFLKTTYHVTGDQSYQQHYLDLIRNHHYALNTVDPVSPPYDPLNYGDIELAILSFYPLLTYETDPYLRAIYQEAMIRVWRPERISRSPFLNIFTAALLDQPTGLEPALRELREIPMDMIMWPVANSWRHDLTIATVRSRWGERRFLEPAPAPERPITQWDSDPYVCDYHQDARSENSGAYWLLPYWCARYHHLIIPVPGKAHE